MTKPIIYGTAVSGPSRAVYLLVEALGLDVEMRDVDLFSKQTLSDDFIKINPQHTLPTLIDDGHVIWDSHAIMCYLVGKYGKDDSLYPKDLVHRALVDQRLHFDTEVLAPLLRAMARHVFYDNVHTVPADKMARLEEGYDFLNKFLEGRKWLAGDHYTVADMSCIASMSSLDVFLPMSKYPNVHRWLKTCEQELPGYEKANGLGNNALTEAFKAKLQGSS